MARIISRRRELTRGTLRARGDFPLPITVRFGRHHHSPLMALPAAVVYLSMNGRPGDGSAQTIVGRQRRRPAFRRFVPDKPRTQHPRHEGDFTLAGGPMRQPDRSQSNMIKKTIIILMFVPYSFVRILTAVSAYAFWPMTENLVRYSRLIKSARWQ